MDIRHLQIAQHAHQMAVKCTKRALAHPGLTKEMIEDLKESLLENKRRLRQANAALRTATYLERT